MAKKDEFVLKKYGGKRRNAEFSFSSHNVSKRLLLSGFNHCLKQILGVYKGQGTEELLRLAQWHGPSVPKLFIFTVGIFDKIWVSETE